MTFFRRRNIPVVYEKLITVLAVLSLYVCGAGCSGKHEVTGQVFVVNAGGQNIRLGLVGIHVVDRDQLISATEQAVTNSSDFFKNLDITAAGSGATSFWSGLPSPVGLTDAAGEFRVSIRESDLILARTSVLMGGESKQFVWVISAKDLGGSPVLLSNHNLFEGVEASMSLISSLPGIAEVAKLRRVAEQALENNRELTEIGSKNDQAARSSAQAGKQAAEIAAGNHPLVDKTFGRLTVVSNAWAAALVFAQNAGASAAEANIPLVASAAEVAKAEAAVALQVSKTSAQDAESAPNSTTAKKHQEVAANAASEARTASAKAFAAANSAEDFSRDVAKIVNPPDRRLETVGRLAESAKASANDAAEASRQAALYAQAAQKSVAMKEALESAINGALAAVDARIRSERASTLASNALNSALATESLAAAKAASFAASQAESSLDQVNRVLQRSRELSSADLPKLVREASLSKSIADQGAKEARHRLVAFEALANEVPELVIKLTTNTTSRGLLETGTNAAIAIRENLKQGQAMVTQIVTAVKASARGHQITDEAFVYSLLALKNELVNSVETNAKAAKDLADSSSTKNLSVVDAEKNLDRVETILKMAELEAIAIVQIDFQLTNATASGAGARVEKALILARNANGYSAKRLAEAKVKAEAEERELQRLAAESRAKADAEERELQRLAAESRAKADAEERERQRLATESKAKADATDAKFASTLGISQPFGPGARGQVGVVPVRWIPRGQFAMGSPSGESGRELSEIYHSVALSRGFFLAESECTQGQWEMVMGGNPSKSKGSEQPVEQVSWGEAVEYCRKLTAKQRVEGILPDGWEWRLPTEAEWEYAARAGTTGARYGELDTIAWYGGNSGSQTHPVKHKAANAWGLYDMMGNVWEWCADWYDEYPTGNVTDPRGPSSGSFRVNRGGSWSYGAGFARSASRYWDDPGFRYNYLGFRPALSSVR
jgi:formylglycine-generating enzyme required for sulfatase activity